MNDFDLRIALREIKEEDWIQIHKYASQEKGLPISGLGSKFG
ncbi:hypothetical protein [Sporolactobacillus laevolacticus]